uniref:Thioredoxin domain-containing protein n=1 Tax=Erpetoichthys calabaricus TaxID=27687 RepID=A0A8C4SES7_ERPCA
MVKEVKYLAEFHKELKNDQSNLIMWCGPCKQITQFFESLPGTCPNVVFLKVNVNEAENVDQHCEFRAMPTFAFYRNWQKVQSTPGGTFLGVALLAKRLRTIRV